MSMVRSREARVASEAATTGQSERTVIGIREERERSGGVGGRRRDRGGLGGGRRRGWAGEERDPRRKKTMHPYL
jgi:hypothetical protein